MVEERLAAGAGAQVVLGPEGPGVPVPQVGQVALREGVQRGSVVADGVGFEVGEALRQDLARGEGDGADAGCGVDGSSVGREQEPQAVAGVSGPQLETVDQVLGGQFPEAQGVGAVLPGLRDGQCGAVGGEREGDHVGGVLAGQGLQSEGQ